MFTTKIKTLITSFALLGASVSLPSSSIADTIPSSRTNLAATNVQEFVVIGTEPFWNVTVSKSGIVYSTPEIKKQKFPYVTPLQANGRPEDFVRVYRLQARVNTLLVITKVSTCSDGMSDKNYPYAATFIQGNTVLQGCAQKK